MNITMTAKVAMQRPDVRSPRLGASRERHHMALMRCPRPGCGGRLLLVDLNLEEAVVMCMLCAHELSPKGEWEGRSHDQHDSST